MVKIIMVVPFANNNFRYLFYRKKLNANPPIQNSTNGQNMGEYLCDYRWETTLKHNNERYLKEKGKQRSLVNSKSHLHIRNPEQK